MGSVPQPAAQHHVHDAATATTQRGERPNSLRVLTVTPRNPLGQGGVERHVMEVNRRLVAAGVCVEVLCANPGGPVVAEERSDGVTIRAVRAWPAKRDYFVAPGMWREIACRPWDVVHVQSYHTFVAPLAMLRALSLGIPYVLTFHGGGHSSPVRQRLRGVQRRALRPLLVRAARLVAVARFEIEEYGRELALPPERFVLIPNGTDIAVINDAAANPSANGPVFASIGRLEKYKGHHRVLAAVPHVIARRPDSKLLIVGTGPYESELRSQAADLGVSDHVEFTSVPPGDKAMGKILARASLVVLLSDFETHPLVGLEAAAAGCRLLVANRAGLRELAEDGIARSIDPQLSPQEIARAIIEELAKPREQQSIRLTSWDECAAALLELYREVRDAQAGLRRVSAPPKRATGPARPDGE